MMNSRSVRLLSHFLIAFAVLAGLARSSPSAPVAARAHRATKPIVQSQPAASLAAAPIEFVDSVGGVMQSFIVDGTTAYVIQGGGLTVLDVSTPAAPARIGGLALVDQVGMLAIEDGILYVINQKIMQVVDVHNPAQPAEIARYTPRASSIHVIQVSGGFAYLKTADDVEIVDVRSPALPIYAATYTHAPRVADFFVAGGLAYVVDGTNVLTIVDLSDPGAPSMAGTFTVESAVQTVLYHLTVQGHRLYISAVMSDLPSYPGLVVLDVTQSTAPALLANLQLASYPVTFAGNIGYLQDPQLNGLWVLDMSDPAHPVTHGMYQGDIGRAVGQEFVQVVGDRAYYIEQFQTLKIVDATNLDTAVVLGSYASPPGLKFPFRLQVAGDSAYVLSRGLQVLDITNPISPTLRGYYPSEYALMLHVAGNHAYLDKNLSALDLLDISDPNLPTLLGSMTTGLVQAVAEAADRAYLLTETQESCGKFCVITHNALTIMDISNPTAPQLLGRAQLFDTSSIVAGGIAVSGGYVYVGWGDGLRVVDISNPAAPAVRANYPITAGADAIQLVGDLAYLIGPTGLQIISLANPLKPALIGQTGSLGDFVYSIQVQGGLAIVGSSSGVRVVDIADPRRPLSRASYGDARGPAQIKGDTIYVAGDTAGLYILRLHSDRFIAPMYLPLARH